MADDFPIAGPGGMELDGEQQNEHGKECAHRAKDSKCHAI